jgi:hypothetical protein
MKSRGVMSGAQFGRVRSNFARPVDFSQRDHARCGKPSRTAPIATQFSFITQTFGELTRAPFAHGASHTVAHAHKRSCTRELLFVASVSPRDVEKIDVFAPCG